MLLSFITLFAILISGSAAGLYTLYKKRTKSEIRVPTSALIIGITLVVVFGILFTPILTFQLQDQLKVEAWPTVEGKIDSSHVIGARAFRPDIEYDYVVNGIAYHDSSDLNVPGFGGRMNRLDAAEKLVQLYPPEKTITVYYNPENPGDSTLKPNPSYALFLKLGTSIILSIIGFAIIFIRGFMPKQKSQYKERM